MTSEIDPPTTAKIASFWTWFSENRHAYERLRPGESAWVTLDRWLGEMGVDSWEIGPGPHKENFLAISPGGDPRKLKITRRIVADAPAIDGWVFLAAKPPKRWNRVFEWSSRRIRIDASRWRFAIYRYDDGMMELVLLEAPCKDLSREEQIRIIDFVVESEIGEELLLGAVCGVDFDVTPSPEIRKTSVDIENLRHTMEATCTQVTHSRVDNQ